MEVINKNIKWIMIIAGLITCSMIFAVFAPQAVLINMFGEALTAPLAQVVVRSWGFLIFLMGALLIYGAIKPKYRNLSLVLTTISKVVFILLIITFGAQYIEKSLVTLILDASLVLVFISYLMTVKRNKNN